MSPSLKRIDDETFVLAWEAHALVADVAAKLGMSHRAAISRAWRLRDAGVGLTRKPRSRPRTAAHFKKLNALIQKKR